MTTTNSPTLTDEQIRNIENDQAKMPGVSRENLTVRTVRAALVAQHGFCIDEDQCTCAREIGYRVCQPNDHTSPIGEDAANGAIGEREAFEEIRSALEETYSFASTSPRSQENINFVFEKLDELEKGRAESPALVGYIAHDAIDYLRCGGQQVSLWASNHPETSVALYARAALTAEKAAAEPVGEVTATVLEGADQGVIGWYGDPLPVNSLLYAAPQQPAQSAEQDEPCTNCGMSVDPKCACERGRKRAASTQSTATQPVQADTEVTCTHPVVCPHAFLDDDGRWNCAQCMGTAQPESGGEA